MEQDKSKSEGFYADTPDSWTGEGYGIVGHGEGLEPGLHSEIYASAEEVKAEIGNIGNDLVPVLQMLKITKGLTFTVVKITAVEDVELS